MKAVKGNKEYTITEGQQQAYQDSGFDIYDNGKQIAYGRGKTVPYGDYANTVKKLEALETENKQLKESLAKLGTNSVKEETSQKKAEKKAGE